MEITEVRVKLLAGRSDRLRAFCSVTFDDEFVVHDLRVIDGKKGLFVAMPSRKLTDKCPACGGKNHLRANYCCECGESLNPKRAKDRDKYHVDVAHPIKTPCREKIKEAVLSAYKEELEERGILEEEIGDTEELQEAEEDYPEDEEDFGEESPKDEEAFAETSPEDEEDFAEESPEDEDLDDWNSGDSEYGESMIEDDAEDVAEGFDEDETDYEEDEEDEEGLTDESDETEEESENKSGGFGEGIL